LVTYIGNKIAAITDYSERWDHGEIISTAFAESTVDMVRGLSAGGKWIRTYGSPRYGRRSRLLFVPL
jgi:hypothetical protein